VWNKILNEFLLEVEGASSRYNVKAALTDICGDVKAVTICLQSCIQVLAAPDWTQDFPHTRHRVNQSAIKI